MARRLATGHAVAHFLAQNVKYTLCIAQAQLGKRPTDQVLGRRAKQTPERGIGVGHRAVGQGDEDHEVGRLVEQRVKALQTIDVLAQLRVVALVERAFAKADDAGTFGFPVVHFRSLPRKLPARRPTSHSADS